MNPFFIHLDLFDPNGQARMRPGDTYGCDRSFMVGHANDKASFLGSMLDVLEREGLGLLRIIGAGAPEDYEDVDGRDIDLPALIDEARVHDVLVAKPGRSFRPHGITNSGKCLTMIDIFDPEEAKEGPYAGELHDVVVVGTPPEALRSLLRHLEDENLTLKSMTHLFDVKDEDYVDLNFEGAADILNEARPGAPAWGPGLFYETEDDGA